jgi:hypothetical protein
VANDAPFRALHEITEALNMPKEQIRFINPLQGGGFGSKGGLKVEPIAVALAFHTDGRPVRVKFNREETFISTLTRHEAVVYSKTGVKKDGTLMARQMTIYWGAGAYAEKSPTVCIRGSLPAPNVKVDGYTVYAINQSQVPSGYGIRRAWAGSNRWTRSPGVSAWIPRHSHENIFVEAMSPTREAPRRRPQRDAHQSHRSYRLRQETGQPQARSQDRQRLRLYSETHPLADHFSGRSARQRQG